MDVTYQFQQVRVLFAQDGFIAVLEKGGRSDGAGDYK